MTTKEIKQEGADTVGKSDCEDVGMVPPAVTEKLEAGSVSEAFATWRTRPDDVAAHEANKVTSAKNAGLISQLDHKSSDELEKLYFDKGVNLAVKVAIVARGRAPYTVVSNALFSDEPLLAEVACVHHILTDEDLSRAENSHKWRIVRTEASRVLARRREVGYTGPTDKFPLNLAS